MALNHLKSARESFRQTIQALDVAKLTTERRQKWQRDIQIMLAMLDKNKDLKDGKFTENFPFKYYLFIKIKPSVTVFTP